MLSSYNTQYVIVVGHSCTRIQRRVWKYYRLSVCHTNSTSFKSMTEHIPNESITKVPAWRWHKWTWRA